MKQVCFPLAFGLVNNGAGRDLARLVLGWY
jgi:hypothetical protein